jgi:hypothetical protein
VTKLAGSPAARSEDRIDEHFIIIDATDDDGGLRITPMAVVRLCGTREAILDDIDGFGIGFNPNAAAPVVAVPPDAT